MGARERLDVLLVERGLAPTRGRAQALILAGRVSSAGLRLDKPGIRLATDAPLSVRAGRRFVSRGGTKLAGALPAFSVDPRGRDALDVGASTGGFTQVLLEAGARQVIALDVGHGQLDAGLRGDPRVHVLERTNARYLEPAALPYRPDLAVVDVSFISLRLVLPGVVRCLTAQGEIVVLVKPQFEVGRGQVGRGGIVRDPALHRRVLHDLGAAAAAARWGLTGVCRSELAGHEGNQEYFAHLCPGQDGLAEAELLQEILAVTEPVP